MTRQLVTILSTGNRVDVLSVRSIIEVSSADPLSSGLVANAIWLEDGLASLLAEDGSELTLESV